MKKSLKRTSKATSENLVDNIKLEDIEEKKVESNKKDEDGDKDSGEPPAKKKKKRGMNKNRPRAAKLDFNQQLCNSICRGEDCSYGDKCRYLHDVAEYMAKYKPADIGEWCVNFDKFGKCIYGVTCRYGKKHISEDFKNIVNEKLYEETAALRTKNVLSKDLTMLLRKKSYEFPNAEAYLNHLAKVKAEGEQNSGLGSLVRPSSKPAGAVTDEDVIKLRPQEKKKVKYTVKELVLTSLFKGDSPCLGWGGGYQSSKGPTLSGVGWGYRIHHLMYFIGFKI